MAWQVHSQASEGQKTSPVTASIFLVTGLDTFRAALVYANQLETGTQKLVRECSQQPPPNSHMSPDEKHG